MWMYLSREIKKNQYTILLWDWWIHWSDSNTGWLKSPVIRIFVQKLAQANNIESVKSSIYCPFVRGVRQCMFMIKFGQSIYFIKLYTIYDAQWASNAENVVILWCHRCSILLRDCKIVFINDTASRYLDILRRHSLLSATLCIQIYVFGEASCCPLQIFTPNVCACYWLLQSHLAVV